MVDHPANRPHEVDELTGDFIYLLYKLLFTADIDQRIKQRTLETGAESKNSWRVVSISEKALEHLKKHRSAKGLQRGHILTRASRAQHLFNRANPLTRNELLTYFFLHDTVALVTKEENAIDGASHWSPLREVPQGAFNAGSFSIYVRQKVELAWVDGLNLNPPAPLPS